VRRRWRGALAGAVLLLSPLSGLRPEAAPTREQELDQIRLEILRLQARLDQARGQTLDLEGEIQRTGLQLELQGKQVAEAAAAHGLAHEQLELANRAVAALEQTLAGVRVELKDHLLALYRLGRPGYLRLFLSLKPGAELLPAIRELRFLAHRDADLVGRYEDAKARLDVERGAVAEHEREARAWLEREEVRRRELAATRAREQQLLARLEGEKRSLADRFGVLADREKKLAGFLDFLYGRNEGGVAGRSMQEFRGVLDWPVEGRVVERFGPRLDPRYGTQTPHNGVGLATRAGAAVKAIYPGRVAYAAPFEGYGPTVIVQHAGHVFSLYAGLAQVRVARGDVLALGAPLGLASDKLYIEIRVENRPEDPLAWMR